MGRSKQRANARTLTLGEFFKETQVNRTSGLLGARLARRRAESDSDDADDGETTDALECAIGNAARASGEGTYDVTCFARGGRAARRTMAVTPSC